MLSVVCLYITGKKEKCNCSLRESKAMKNQLKMKGGTECYKLRLTSEGAALAVQDKKTEERFG